MSDSDGDFSDELLELAGAGEKRRKKTSPRSHAKRRKPADVKSESEKEYESEEDDSNPYPLEGKYIDEADREGLLQLPEIERESILSQRLEEIQRFQDKRNLDQMLREQRGEIDGVAKAAKRHHQARGATEKKSRKLDELKAKRKAKSEKKQRVSSPKRERSSSPMDMEMSSEDEEDGQISKEQQEEEREARLLNKTELDEEEATLYDLDRCRLSRDTLKQFAYMPWFEEYVKGAYVRYLTRRDEQQQSVYRICEVFGVAEPSMKPYKIDSESFDVRLDLKYGSSVRSLTMDNISNGSFTEIEFQRLKLVNQEEKFKMPSKRTVEKKIEQYAELPKHVLTEAEVAYIVERKARFAGTRSAISKAALDRAELVRRRDLAQRRRDFTESAQLESQIAELDAMNGSYAEKEKEDILAKINERNRQANREAVSRLEAAEAERKRRAWMTRAANSRPGTPGVQKSETPAGSPGGTPKLSATLPVASANGEKRSFTPLPPGKGPLGKRTFESIVANSVDIDLGDF